MGTQLGRRESALYQHNELLEVPVTIYTSRIHSQQHPRCAKVDMLFSMA